MLSAAATAAAVCLYHTVSFRRGSHGITTAVAVLQGLRFVPATNSVLLKSVCACARRDGTRVSPKGEEERRGSGAWSDKWTVTIL